MTEKPNAAEESLAHERTPAGFRRAMLLNLYHTRGSAIQSTTFSPLTSTVM